MTLEAPDPASVTDEEFRAIGYTWAARKYPLTKEAVQILCWANGLRLDQVTPAWWFAPNEACQVRCENLVGSPFLKLVTVNGEALDANASRQGMVGA